jgi:hypothetical protein
MAKEIATENKINVFRKDRDFLLSIKAGQLEYSELLQKAEKIKDELPFLYEQSHLPDIPDIEEIDRLLIEIREAYYQ